MAKPQKICGSKITNVCDNSESYMNIKSDHASVVVTGVAGVTGGQTVLEFANAGYSVLGIDTTTPQEFVIEALTKFIQSDFGSDRSLLAILKHRPVKIFYCGDSKKTSEEWIENDSDGAKRLMEGINDLGYFPEIIIKCENKLLKKIC